MRVRAPPSAPSTGKGSMRRVIGLVAKGLLHTLAGLVLLLVVLRHYGYLTETAEQTAPVLEQPHQSAE
jgi:hypothetical protein